MATTSVDQVTGYGETLALKAPCRLATTANIALSGLQTIDGVATAADDRVLVRGQSTPSQNGIYIAASSAWQRARDMDSNRDLTRGTRVYVTEGDSGPAEFEVTTESPITVGSSSIAFDLSAGSVNAAALSAAAATAVAARNLAQQYAADAAQVSGVNVPIYAAVATAAAATIAAGVKSIRTQFYNPSYAIPSTLVGAAEYSRISKADIDTSAYPASTYFRSTDRTMPNGSTDATNGGYWYLSSKEVNAEMIGAVGNGVTDVGPLWDDILTFMGQTGASYKGIPGTVHLIGTSASALRTASSHDLMIDLNGSKLICNDSNLSFIGSDVPFLTTTLSVEPIRGAPKITLTSVTGIAVGDFIEITSPALSQNAIGVYHYYVVNEIDGNDLYIEGTVVADINAQQIIDDGQVGAISVKAYKLVGDITFKNGEVEAVDPSGLRSSLYFRNFNNVLVDNVIFTGKTREQITIQSCAYWRVRDCNFKDFGYKTKDSGYVNEASAPGGDSFGYGVLINRSFRGAVSNCVGGRGWHLADASRGAMHVTYDSCFLSRNSFGLSCHEGAWYVNVIDCIFDGGDGIQGTRCAYLTVRGSTFRNLRDMGIGYAGLLANVEVRIHDCHFDTGWLVGTTNSPIYNAAAGNPNAGCSSVGWVRVFEMIGCTFSGYCRVYGGLGGDDTGRLVIKGNTFYDNAILYSVVPLHESVISGNDFGDINGQYAMSLNCSSLFTASIRVKDNTQDGTFSTASNSALIYLDGAGTPDISLFNNTVEAQFLVRFNSTVAGIAHCVGNTNRTGRMFLGAATNTVGDCHKNVYAGSNIQTGGVVITREDGSNYSNTVGLTQALATDVAFTLTPFTSPFETRHTGTLTADRAVTLSTTGAVIGQKFRITRTGAGAFNLTVGTGPLKALATGTWAEVVYDGAAWYLAAYGAL
ncbi:MAG: hypothetical protein E5X81_20855 [Mesorhizobium sp.]|nr:MAG: hypothetical protein E5X81_20855 [Mesorhizobium sp.]